MGVPAGTSPSLLTAPAPALDRQSGIFLASPDLKTPPGSRTGLNRPFVVQAKKQAIQQSMFENYAASIPSFSIRPKAGDTRQTCSELRNASTSPSLADTCNARPHLASSIPVASASAVQMNARIPRRTPVQFRPASAVQGRPQLPHSVMSPKRTPSILDSLPEMN